MSATYVCLYCLICGCLSCHVRCFLVLVSVSFSLAFPFPVFPQFFFFFNDTATTEIYTLHIVGSVRCVQETGTWGDDDDDEDDEDDEDYNPEEDDDILNEDEEQEEEDDDDLQQENLEEIEHPAFIDDCIVFDENFELPDDTNNQGKNCQHGCFDLKKGQVDNDEDDDDDDDDCLLYTSPSPRDQA
eukprot:TRINITY_DN6809_c0_g1_i1.p3 TRINITY_DN6809_c0_g1~~TRINITY_DN6809_c0_g1_i1.p3  ORF type:complete len:186 (-),score=48.24 TRINITY_DN6809_c0_g1_i1:60-617(-)